MQKAPDQLGASALAQASADLEGRGTTGAAEAGNTTGAAAEEGKGQELGDTDLQGEQGDKHSHTFRFYHNHCTCFCCHLSSKQQLSPIINAQRSSAIMPSLTSLSSIIYA